MKKNWPIRPLQSLCNDFKQDIVDGPFGSELQRKDYITEGVPVLKIQNIKPFAIELKKMDYISGAKFNELKRHSFRLGDIVMTKLGCPLGVSTIVEGMDEGVIVADLVRIRAQQVDTKYLCYQLNSQKTNEFINAQQKGTTRPRVTLSVVRQLPILVPPLAEQQRIVGLLDEAFAGLATAQANAEKNLQNARALFESHLQSVFTSRSKGWVKTTLSEATGGIFTGPFGSLLHKSDYVENGIPLVNPAHITEIGIEPDLRKTVSKETAKRLASYIMREGDIVIGRRGEMGRCALVTKVEDGWLCGTGSFFIKASSRCHAGYLVRFLRSYGCKQRLEKIAGGAVMPNLSNTDLGNFRFDLPPLERQKEIVQAIDALSTETQRLESLCQQKLAALAALKKSLLHQAFSGAL